MTHQMNIDMDKVKQGVADLKAHPPTEQEVAADPKAFPTNELSLLALVDRLDCSFNRRGN